MRGFAAMLSILAVGASCGTSPKAEPTTPASSQSHEIQSAAETQPEAEAAPAPVPPAEPEPPPPPPPPPGSLVTITVVSAELAGRMPNGAEWDAKEPNGATATEPSARYLSQHPELADAADFVGIPVDAEKLADNAKKTPAADPMVFIEVGDRIFRTPVKPRQFHPVWDFAATFLYGTNQSGSRVGVAKGATVQLHVVDWDGPGHHDSVGATLVELDTLLGAKIHELGPFGSVVKLVLRVDEAPLPDSDAAAIDQRVAIPGNAPWTDTGIEVVAGQRLIIDAGDEVCSKGGSLSHCSGPEGQRRTSSYNVPGFKKLGHGALIGAIGDTRFPVKRGLSLVAPSSGRLLLGINDKDTGDNRGSYAVRVVIDPLP